jgi:hypothetical protein
MLRPKSLYGQTIIYFVFSTIAFGVAVPAFCQLEQHEMELLSLIAHRNRANQELLNSFYYEYKSKSWLSQRFVLPKQKSPRDKPMTIERDGRYAFSGDRTYSFESNNLGQFSHYVSDKNQQRTSTVKAPRIVMLSKEGKLQKSPGPWNQLGAGIATKLDTLNPLYDKVVSVKQTGSANDEYIVVTIKQRLASSPPDQYNNTLTLHFSVEDGFMPVRIQQTNLSESGKPAYTSDAVGSKMLKYQVGGSILYLPAETHEERYQDGALLNTYDFAVDANSVQINPELPDELFRIDIQPGDLVVDKDLGTELANPFSLDLVSSDEFYDRMPESETEPSDRLVDSNVTILTDISNDAMGTGQPNSLVGTSRHVFEIEKPVARLYQHWIWIAAGLSVLLGGIITFLARKKLTKGK